MKRLSTWYTLQHNGDEVEAKVLGILLPAEGLDEADFDVEDVIVDGSSILNDLSDRQIDRIAKDIAYIEGTIYDAENCEEFDFDGDLFNGF